MKKITSLESKNFAFLKDANNKTKLAIDKDSAIRRISRTYRYVVKYIIFYAFAVVLFVAGVAI
ncbi:MAG: hypothetical protein AAGG68_25670 [Bacteroidota bacterium]